MGAVLPVSAQQDIVALEYFVDIDPGVGNATAVAITPGQSITESFAINTSALSLGYHILGVRTQNAENRWSMHERRLFLIQDLTGSLDFPKSVVDIQAAEYFVDTDPGPGNGFPITTAGGPTISESFTVPTNVLSTGYHLIGIRIQNAEGRWSMHERRQFLIQDLSNILDFPEPVADIQALEYFIDDDPGPGNGTSIPTSGGSLVSESVVINTDALAVGYHIFGIRSQNTEGRWSMHERRLFLIQDPEDDLGFPKTVSNIANAEYYIDTDPGVGNGIAFTAAGMLVAENLTISTAALDPGYHILGIRMQNTEGRWGMHERRLFLIQDPESDLEFPSTVSPIVALEYFVDEDPGVGNGIQVPVNTPINLVELANLMATTDPGLTAGPHTFYIRGRNEAGRWGFVQAAAFEVEIADRVTPTDSLALEAIYISLGGDDWTNNTNWLTIGQNIEDWFGITLNAQGNEVIALTLPANNLIGTIPVDIDQLTALETIDLSGNNIEAVETDLTSLNNATAIDLSGNRLDFGDLEPIASVSSLIYANQQNTLFLDQMDQNLRVGSDLLLSVTTPGSANSYQWSLNGTDISGATAASYNLVNMDQSQQGIYEVEVSNDDVPDLTFLVGPVSIQATASLTVSAVQNANVISENINAYLFTLDAEVADTLEFEMDPNLNVDPNSYIFPDVPLGRYLLALESVEPFLSANGDEIPGAFIPTYLGDQFLSRDADTLFLADNEMLSIEMQTIPEVATGPGVITGTIEEDFPEETERVDARRRAKKRKCGLRRRRTGGRTDQSSDDFDLIAYGETNDNGEFEYGFLPSGFYQFFVEYPGIPLDESAFVEFEVGQEGISDTEFVLAVFVSPDGVSIELVLGITTDYFVDLSIYPNPTTDLLIVSYTEIKMEKVEMEIRDLKGAVLFSKELDNRKNQFDYDTSLLPSGQYFVTFKGGGQNTPLTYKIIKK